MLNPTGKAPKAFGSDARYGDVPATRSPPATTSSTRTTARRRSTNMAAGWASTTCIASDRGGQRAWNFDAEQGLQISARRGRPRRRHPRGDRQAATRSSSIPPAAAPTSPPRRSAYLYNQGFRKARASSTISPSSSTAAATGRSSTSPRRATSPASSPSRSRTRTWRRYANGMDGPDLKHARSPTSPRSTAAPSATPSTRRSTSPSASRRYVGLKAGTTFKTTTRRLRRRQPRLRRRRRPPARRLGQGGCMPATTCRSATPGRTDRRQGRRPAAGDLQRIRRQGRSPRLLDGDKSSTVKGAAAACPGPGRCGP